MTPVLWNSKSLSPPLLGHPVFETFCFQTVSFQTFRCQTFRFQIFVFKTAGGLWGPLGDLWGLGGLWRPLGTLGDSRGLWGPLGGLGGTLGPSQSFWFYGVAARAPPTPSKSISNCLFPDLLISIVKSINWVVKFATWELLYCKIGVLSCNMGP